MKFRPSSIRVYGALSARGSHETYMIDWQFGIYANSELSSNSVKIRSRNPSKRGGESHLMPPHLPSLLLYPLNTLFCPSDGLVRWEDLIARAATGSGEWSWVPQLPRETHPAQEGAAMDGPGELFNFKFYWRFSAALSICLYLVDYCAHQRTKRTDLGAPQILIYVRVHAKYWAII